mgnify:CR=1 FL=1
MHRFKDLEIWKSSRKFCSEIYAITSNFPESEKFGLTNQLRRASVSVPSNIAEGSGRTSDKEFLYFLNIALGSSYELETQTLLISDIYQIEIDNFLTKLHLIQKQIGSLKRTLEK